MNTYDAVNHVTMAQHYHHNEQDEGRIHQFWTDEWIVLIDTHERKGVFYLNPDEELPPVVLLEVECGRILNDLERRASVK